jgi:glucokinase
MQHVIGIDLGGTAIKLGLISADGRCLRSQTLPTPQPSEPKAVLQAIVGAIATLDPEHQASAIGIGTPGPADKAGRIARIAINLVDWHEVPVADYLETHTGRPTIVENDANCAGLGEKWLGAGQPFDNWILLTLGTGVGGAVFLNGHLFRGRTGAAGELGLITLYPEGPACNSGNNGSLEQYGSIRAIHREIGLAPDALAAQAHQGDPTAIAFWHQYGLNLGAGLASLVYVLTPEVILLGGGISAASELFLATTQAELNRRVMPTSRENLQILIAKLGNQAGIFGAAYLALNLP